mmetsp:Transcript_38789/g.60386  ORF Transcript_38789/g.60386 Transcript_38789/m.60386 type:complete len:216 (-) Transcript_38789:62-709(-)
MGEQNIRILREPATWRIWRHKVPRCFRFARTPASESAALKRSNSMAISGVISRKWFCSCHSLAFDFECRTRMVICPSCDASKTSVPKACFAAVTWRCSGSRRAINLLTRRTLLPCTSSKLEANANCLHNIVSSMEAPCRVSIFFMVGCVSKEAASIQPSLDASTKARSSLSLFKLVSESNCSNALLSFEYRTTFSALRAASICGAFVSVIPMDCN